MKRNIQTADQNWNNWKFQMHWNMLEWVHPRSKIVRKEAYSTSSKKYCTEKYDRMAHWIRYSKIKTLYYNDFFEQKKIIDELEASLTGAPIYAKILE